MTILWLEKHPLKYKVIPIVITEQNLFYINYVIWDNIDG